MNERIKELWWKARIGYNEQNCDPEVLEKFAELIVAECIEVCRRGKFDRKDDLSTIQYDSGIRFCINAIDNHFGD